VRVWLALTALLVLSATSSLSAGEQSLVEAAAAAAKAKAEASAAGRDWHPIYFGNGSALGLPGAEQQSEWVNLWERVTTTNRGDDVPRVVWNRLSNHQQVSDATCQQGAQGMSDASLKEWNTSLVSQSAAPSMDPVIRPSTPVDTPMAGADSWDGIRAQVDSYNRAVATARLANLRDEMAADPSTGDVARAQNAGIQKNVLSVGRVDRMSSTITIEYREGTRREFDWVCLPSTVQDPAALTTTVARDPNGRIQRSEAMKHAFEVQTNYPQGRPGYIVDHIQPLACGGADDPSNMQWQTIEAAKAKDKVERLGCR
jgi:hypothetical protein